MRNGNFSVLPIIISCSFNYNVIWCVHRDFWNYCLTPFSGDLPSIQFLFPLLISLLFRTLILIPVICIWDIFAFPARELQVRCQTCAFLWIIWLNLTPRSRFHSRSAVCGIFVLYTELSLHKINTFECFDSMTCILGR